jgi:hypothetical protein
MLLSVVTFDVKGGFDNILPNRLLNLLKSQGWPTHVISWVSSLLTRRLASLRIDGTADNPTPTAGSLPQGSPTSPIFFMLFMQPLFASHIRGSLPTTGYADDGKLTAQSASVEENCVTLAQELDAVIRWCDENKIPLDHSKTQLMHCTRSTKAPNSPLLELQELPCPPLQPISCQDALKWLGVLFDRRHTF